MLTGFLVLFRETLEAALIIGLSLLAGFLLWNAAGGFSGKGEELFEGATMLVAAFLLTTVVLRMRNQGNFSERLKRQVAEKGAIGIILRGLFGCSGDPSLLEVAAYLAYVAFGFAAWGMKKSPDGRKIIFVGGNNG